MEGLVGKAHGPSWHNVGCCKRTPKQQNSISLCPVQFATHSCYGNMSNMKLVL